uniref:von Willebrand factor A domain-containing protein 1 n=1 Tax=Sinocyclocheilus grahami TaxID=75366 RepID=A0A672MK17_SINGR
HLLTLISFRTFMTLFLNIISLNVYCCFSPTVLNCCEGDVLFLLDSSGSVASYEFFRMVDFLKELLLPFSLGPDQVRVGLLQVGTEPHLEFSFDTYSSQDGLQAALERTKQLKGDTNTVDALLMARNQVLKQGVPGGARPDLPRVLVWLTDGVDPGEVQEPMARLREEGVAILVVSTGHGNYQVLREAVSPPAEEHLFFVDIDDINIISEDLRNAIIEIIRAERLQVKSVTTTTAQLEWRPVLAGTGYYDIQFGPIRSGQTGGTGGPGTSPGTGLGPFQRITRPGDASSAKLTDLRPDTTYTVTLTPKANLEFLNSLHTTFTTQPGADLSIIYPDQISSKNQKQKKKFDILHNIYILLFWCTLFHLLLPALSDLQLTTVGNESVQLRWKGSYDGLRGYWVTWERGQSQRSTLYLPPNRLSTTLNHVPSRARVCVSPVYRTARGEGLCCTA